MRAGFPKKRERPVTSRVWGWFLAVLTVGVLALSFGLAVRFAGFTFDRLQTDVMDIHADFNTFWMSARAMWEGMDLYDTDARLPNLNPPLWTLLISPLGFLDALLAYRIFMVSSIVTMLGYLAWMSAETRVASWKSSLATGMLLVSSPFLATLALGQVYVFLTLGLVASWSLDRRGQHILSGVALGLTIAIKPSLLPVALWPLFRKRWDALVATLATGAFLTFVAALSVGFGTTFDWLRLISREPLNTYWDNASLPSAAARLFTENQFAEELATLPWMVTVFYGVGVVLIFATAWLTRRDPSLGIWAMVAASLLASPLAWNNYLMLLVPGIFILMARGRFAVALLLLALQTISPQWPLIWINDDTPLATLMLTLYMPILLIHWLALLPTGILSDPNPKPSPQSPTA